MQQEISLLCNQCPTCQGFGCIGQMPGMGGVNNNKNFQLNCQGWHLLRGHAKKAGTYDALQSISVNEKNIYIAPVTGAVQNIGYKNEKDFYTPYITAAYKAGVGIALGDGIPDEKLQFGIQAVKDLQKDIALQKRATLQESAVPLQCSAKSDSSVQAGEVVVRTCDNTMQAGGDTMQTCDTVQTCEDTIQAAVFLKPYSNDVLFERIEWCKSVANIIGNDIDAYNIATMRNLARLEKKSASAIKELRERAGLPYAMKGVFTKEDIELVKETMPDIVVVSNHGGRIETDVGSTALFLFNHAKELKKYCGEVWVDGGIRSKEDVQSALHFGADRVMTARPFIISLATSGVDGMIKSIENIIKG